MKISAYEENFTLHAENARLRKIIESYEQGNGYDLLMKKWEDRIRKAENSLKRTVKERDRYHELWQKQVQKNRYSSDFDQDVRIASLEATIQLLNDTISELRSKNDSLKSLIEELSGTISKLKAQMNRDYENSSIPSSQKPNHKKIKNSREKTDRKPGAQLGHSGHKRPHLTPTETFEIPVPEHILNDPDYYLTGNIIRKQVADISISVNVTEYCTPEYRSRSTGVTGHAAFPDGIRDEFSYGGNVKAFAFLLNNFCGVSIDKTKNLISELTGGTLDLSKGLINRLPKYFSDSTKEERQKIYDRLLLAPVMYSDATSGRVNGTGTQVIVCTNENEVLYFFREHKGFEGLKDTPVSEYKQILVHDHDKTYYHYGSDHQECLSHVIRYLKDSIDNEPELTWASRMSDLFKSLIHDHKVQKGLLSDEAIHDYETRYDEIIALAENEYELHPPTKYYPEGFNLMKRLKEYKHNHLLFLYHPEVGYTNNISERALRKYKRKQKQAVTFRSNQSVEYLCNAMSILETRRLFGANLYDSAISVFNS